jgi:hypothetical protein
MSPAFGWLPHFARSVVCAFAHEWRGYRNGAIELSPSTAATYGITENELRAGIALALRAKLLLLTVPSRRRSGKGSPAKYAISWEPLGDVPAFGIVPTNGPASDEWRSVGLADLPPRPRGIRAAEELLGWRSARQGPAREHSDRADVPPEILEGVRHGWVENQPMRPARVGRSGGLRPARVGRTVRHGWVEENSWDDSTEAES